MKTTLTALLLITSFTVSAQYYYKDILGTQETAVLINAYKNNNVTRVVLNSYDAEGTRSDEFFVEQIYSPSARTLRTITRSGVTDESVLTSYINGNGQVEKTVDSTETLVSVTEYRYDAAGRLTNLISTSSDSSKSLVQTEEHFWEYSGGKPVRMRRIKNKTDTMDVRLKLDENGNVTEEQNIHRSVASEPVYYYYDKQNRLTDIVRFNNKARRLLPEYMFEYSSANQVIQRITVPANGSEYLIWRYQYDNRGLKVKEAVYNKRKELTGKIEYQYQTGS